VEVVGLAEILYGTSIDFNEINRGNEEPTVKKLKRNAIIYTVAWLILTLFLY
jgi:hypothetical protein